ncbi:MAG TPA: ABC transporter substrate-binding protein [Thermodesulfovibrionales bacterium]|nr:ABC transporter substrate-binding protein [Thermodesulfovibrionales bacterium]
MRLFIVTLWCIGLSVLPALGDDTIRIGAIVSATGPASFLGEPEKNTALMLQDKINSQGGILGKKIEIVIYDDETDVNKAVLATEKLLKKDKVVAVIGPTTSGCCLAVEDKYDKAQIPLVSMAASEKIVKPVKKWVYNVAPLDRHAVAKLYKFLRTKGIRKIAIITVSDGFGQSGREVLKELAPGMGIEITADEVYGPKDTDMTAQLTKIKGSGAEGIVCWGTNPGPAIIAKNRVQLGITLPLFMSHGVASKKFIELAGDAAEGIYLPAGRLLIADQIPDSNPQKKILLQYKKEYETRFKSPVSTFGGHAWDSLFLVERAIEMGKSADPASIRDNLEKITGFVGTAGVFNYSPSNHNGLDENAFEIVVIEKGEWKRVK